MPCAGILIDFMSTHTDFLLILRLGKCAGYLKLPDTRIPDKRDFTVQRTQGQERLEECQVQPDNNILDCD